MVEPIISRLRQLLETPLDLYPTPAATIDAWIIVNLKIEHRVTRELLDERIDLERNFQRMIKGLSNKETLLALVEKLVRFHREMWIMEDQVRNTKTSLELRMKYAFEADMRNDERAKLKTEINLLFGCKQGSEAKIRSS